MHHGCFEARSANHQCTMAVLRLDWTVIDVLWASGYVDDRGFQPAWRRSRCSRDLGFGFGAKKYIDEQSKFQLFHQWTLGLRVHWWSLSLEHDIDDMFKNLTWPWSTCAKTIWFQWTLRLRVHWWKNQKMEFSSMYFFGNATTQPWISAGRDCSRDCSWEAHASLHHGTPVPHFGGGSRETCKAWGCQGQGWEWCWRWGPNTFSNETLGYWNEEMKNMAGDTTLVKDMCFPKTCVSHSVFFLLWSVISNSIQIHMIVTQMVKYPQTKKQVQIGRV